MTQSETDDDSAKHFEDVRSRESLFGSLIESAPDALFVIERDGRIVYLNREAERMFGYARAGLLGQLIEMLVPSTQRDAHLAERKRYREAPRVRPMGLGKTLEGQRKDGSRFPVEIALAPVESNGETFITATVRDVTERRRLEDQLQQAQKMEAIGLLAGGVAHDFNNLLCVVLSYCDLLLSDLSPEDSHRIDVSEIKRAGQRAAELTGQLLAFGRRQVCSPRVIDINQTVEGMLRMLRRLLGEHIEIVAVEASSLRKARLDPAQVEQIILNLCINARDAMPTGGRLTIETCNVELDAEYARDHWGTLPGPHVMLAITDSGVGMDKATSARVFEPFFTTKQQGKGTGLGLSTVFGIVRQSGGSIWVYSEVGKGSVFKIYFPVAAEEVAPEPVDALRHVTQRTVTETVLLVEDDLQVRGVVRNILKRLGYQVIDADSAPEAILLSERFSGTIDLLLTDVVMPRMSGHELATRLVPSRPSMKILYMSGYTDNSIIHNGILDAGVDFIQKPLTPESLAQAIRHVLEAPPR